MNKSHTQLIDLAGFMQHMNTIAIPCKLCGRDLNTGDGATFYPRLYVHLAITHGIVDFDILVLIELLFTVSKEDGLRALGNAMPSLAELGFVYRAGRG
jgi:hypothetical protein